MAGTNQTLYDLIHDTEIAPPHQRIQTFKQGPAVRKEDLPIPADVQAV